MKEFFAAVWTGIQSYDNVIYAKPAITDIKVVGDSAEAVKAKLPQVLPDYDIRKFAIIKIELVEEVDLSSS